MRSGRLKIHIQSGNWEKRLCGKRQQGKGWAARNVSQQLRERVVRSGDAPVALQPSPSWRSVSCGMGTSRFFTAPVLALHLLRTLLQTLVLRLLSCCPFQTPPYFVGFGLWCGKSRAWSLKKLAVALSRS